MPNLRQADWYCGVDGSDVLILIVIAALLRLGQSMVNATSVAGAMRYPAALLGGASFVRSNSTISNKNGCNDFVKLCSARYISSISFWLYPAFINFTRSSDVSNITFLTSPDF